MHHPLSSIKHSTAQNNCIMQYKARHDITALFVEGLAAVIPCHLNSLTYDIGQHPVEYAMISPASSLYSLGTRPVNALY